MQIFCEYVKFAGKNMKNRFTKSATSSCTLGIGKSTTGENRFPNVFPGCVLEESFKFHVCPEIVFIVFAQ